MILYKLPEHIAKLLLKNHFLSSPMSFLTFYFLILNFLATRLRYKGQALIITPPILAARL